MLTFLLLISPIVYLLVGLFTYGYVYNRIKDGSENPVGGAVYSAVFWPACLPFAIIVFYLAPIAVEITKVKSPSKETKK